MIDETNKIVQELFQRSYSLVQILTVKLNYVYSACEWLVDDYI